MVYCCIIPTLQQPTRGCLALITFPSGGNVTVSLFASSSDSSAMAATTLPWSIWGCWCHKVLAIEVSVNHQNNHIVLLEISNLL